jgi:hypothetical protein
MFSATFRPFGKIILKECSRIPHCPAVIFFSAFLFFPIPIDGCFNFSILFLMNLGAFLVVMLIAINRPEEMTITTDSVSLPIPWSDTCNIFSPLTGLRQQQDLSANFIFLLRL